MLLKFHLFFYYLFQKINVKVVFIYCSDSFKPSWLCFYVHI